MRIPWRWGAVCAAGALVAGCGPTLQRVIRLRPLEGAATAAPDTGRATREVEGLRITVEPLDRKRLEGLIPNVAANPFLADRRMLFTVFHVEIENGRAEKIAFEPVKCVLLDGMGRQMNGLALAEFERMYPTTHVQTLTYSQVFNEYTPALTYTPDYYKRQAAAERLLKGGEVYSSVRREGLLVFELLRPEAKDVTLLLPGIALYKGHEVEKVMDVKFKFAQEIHPQWE